MPIAELAAAPYNPRQALKAGDPEYAKLRRSIEKFGLVDPVIWNSRTKRVVGGHQRLTVLRDLGHTTAPTVVVDLDERLEKALNIALNKIAGAWDLTLLRDLLTEIEVSGEDVTLTGFDPKEIEEILTRYQDDDPGEDVAVPEPPANPVSRPGDLYELGPHRLVCGDSREDATWDLLMGQELAHCMWTDPPYGVDPNVLFKPQADGAMFEGNRRQDIAPLLREVFAQADRHLRPGAPIYVASAYGPMMLPFIQEFIAAGWNHSATLVWVKNQMSYGGASWIGGYRNQHEAILYGWKRGARALWAGGYDQSAVIDDEPAVGQRTRAELLQLVKELRNDRQTDVIREDKTRHNDLHPTMKPIPLVRRMLANSSEPTHIVLEPFGGSGSTLIAAAQMGRRARVIELEPRFCDVIVQRWENLTKQHARRIPSTGAAA